MNELENDIEFKTTEILTEHFGYQPIAVIDDIINIINEIMYKCTEQLEKLLIERNHKLNEDKELNTKEASEANSIQEIEKGTASLETLLEHSINKNFDKFEIYALRNVFSIPEKLISSGYLRLNHQKKIKLYDNINELDSELNNEYNELLIKISYELSLNNFLNITFKKIIKIFKVSIKLKKKLLVLDFNNKSRKESISDFTDILPLKDTIKFLIKEIKNIFIELDNFKTDLDNEHLINLVNNNKQINDDNNYLTTRVNNILGLNELQEKENEYIQGNQDQLTVEGMDSDNIIKLVDSLKEQ